MNERHVLLLPMLVKLPWTTVSEASGHDGRSGAFSNALGEQLQQSALGVCRGLLMEASRKGRQGYSLAMQYGLDSPYHTQ